MLMNEFDTLSGRLRLAFPCLFLTLPSCRVAAVRGAARGTFGGPLAFPVTKK